jgi:hypothetical protein
MIGNKGTVTVTVFFEAKAGAHVVAQFDEESTYMACLPALEALAKSQGYIVTESLDNEAEDFSTQENQA